MKNFLIFFVFFSAFSSFYACAMEEDRPSYSPSSSGHKRGLVFKDAAEMGSWAQAQEDFIEGAQSFAARVSYLQHFPLPAQFVLQNLRIPFLSQGKFENWENRCRGVLNPENLPASPLNLVQWKEEVNAAAMRSFAAGTYAVPFKIGNAYNFLSLYCLKRHALCIKIADQAENDDQVRQYLREARRSLNYYWCHGFTPLISPDVSLQQLLRDTTIDVAQKFIKVTFRLRALSLDSLGKQECIEDAILNSNRQMVVLGLSIPFKASDQLAHVERYKASTRGELSYGYYELYCFTHNRRYLDLAQRNFDQIQVALLQDRDQASINALRSLIYRANPDNWKEERRKSLFVLLDDEDISYNVDLQIMRRWYELHDIVQRKNMSAIVRHIRDLELFIYTTLLAGDSQAEGQVVPSELSADQLHQVYRQYYVSLERIDILYPTLVDYILSFLMVGDVQGALTRFDAVQDLKFFDGQTLRTHQPHLRRILENLVGDSRSLAESFAPDFEEKQRKREEEKEARRKAASLFSIRHFEAGEGAAQVIPVRMKKESLERKVRRLLKRLQNVSPQVTMIEERKVQAPEIVTEPSVKANSTLEKKELVHPGESRAQREKRERQDRHLRNEEIRVLKRTHMSTKPIEVLAEPLPPRLLNEEANVGLNDPRPLSTFYALTGTAKKVDLEIEDNTWRITREEFITYLKRLGCTERASRHHIMELPESFIYEMNGEVVTILAKELKIGGGSLTLPRWDKIVPDYLRSQIRVAREKIRQAAIKIQNLAEAK